MEATSVTSKGQVTIPKALRQQLGIRQGSRIAFFDGKSDTEAMRQRLAARRLIELDQAQA